MSTLVRVLILEDRAADADLMLYELRQAGFDPDWQRVEAEPDYLAALKTEPDLILADWSLPQFSGLRALRLMNERGLDIPFIIVSGSIGEEAAVEAMRQGADDYLFKDRPARLGQAVQHALKNKQLRQERKRADELLRESELKFRGIFEQSSDGIVLADEQGIIIEWNKSQEQITDIRRADALGKPVWDVLYQTLSQEQKTAIAYERFRTNTQGLFKAGQAAWLNQLQESVILHSDGTRRSVQAVMFPIRTVNGWMVASVVRDITERKLAEQALAESEIKLRSLFAAMQDVIIVYDADGRYLEIAPTNPTNLYRPSDDMLGKTVTELFPPDQASFFVDHIRQTLKIGQLTNAEYSLSFGGQVRWFSASISPLSSNSVIWVAHDVTERKQSEEKIRRQIDYLTALQDIDRTIASAFEMRLSLNILISKTISLLEVDAAAVSLINLTTNSLEFAAGDGFRTNAIKAADIKLGESYAGRAAMEHRIVKIPNQKNEPDNLFLSGFFKEEDFVSYYGVPLIIEGKVIGVLEVFQRSLIKHDQEWLDFLNALAGQAAVAISSAQLFDSLQHSNSELTQAYDATVEGWSYALDLRDKETEGHTQRVTKLTVKLARAFGLSEEGLAQVRWGALLHDIGKMGVPDGILHKPGALTDEEWVKMKLHPAFAYEMLTPIHYLRLALDIPYCHHEKWDGTGYPRELKGEQIPLTARIFAVVDVWDALTSDRPYRLAWTKEKALEHILASSGTHFDPQVVDVFMQMLN